jgi:hypothetical protein
VLEVVAVHGALECVAGGGLYGALAVASSLQERSQTYLSLLPREVVCGLEGAGDTLLDGSVATVVGGQDGVLEASGVLDVDVELAVLALLSESDAGASGGDVGVEDEGHDAAVIRDLGAHSALRTSGSAIADTADLDLWWIRQR